MACTLLETLTARNMVAILLTFHIFACSLTVAKLRARSYYIFFYFLQTCADFHYTHFLTFLFLLQLRIDGCVLSNNFDRLWHVRNFSNFSCLCMFINCCNDSAHVLMRYCHPIANSGSILLQSLSDRRPSIPAQNQQLYFGRQLW